MPAAAAAKSLQSCPTLCNPRDSSPCFPFSRFLLRAALCWGMPWCSLPLYPQQVAACSELGCKTSGRVNQGSLRKGKALYYCWDSALLLSLPVVLPFKIWNKSLCFSHHLSALFCTIHLRTDFLFVLTISLSLITEHWTSGSHSFFFFFFKIWKKKKGLFVYLFIFGCAGSLLLCVGFL